MRSRNLAAAIALLGAGSALSASAEEHVVKAVITNWEPIVTYAKPGDTVKFTGMAGHNSESIEGMLPEGATKWSSKMGEEGFTVTVDKEGAYVYKCTPHMTTGMVGTIVVGDGMPKNMTALDTAVNDVKLGKNMVQRAIKKMKADLESKGIK